MNTELKSAIDLLKNIAKDSHLNNQRHLDLSVCVASERPKYEEALIKVKRAIIQGILTEDDLKKHLGLIA